MARTIKTRTAKTLELLVISFTHSRFSIETAVFLCLLAGEKKNCVFMQHPAISACLY